MTEPQWIGPVLLILGSSLLLVLGNLEAQSVTLRPGEIRTQLPRAELTLDPRRGTGRLTAGARSIHANPGWTLKNINARVFQVGREDWRNRFWRLDGHTRQVWAVHHGLWGNDNVGQRQLLPGADFQVFLGLNRFRSAGLPVEIKLTLREVTLTHSPARRTVRLTAPDGSLLSDTGDWEWKNVRTSSVVSNRKQTYDLIHLRNRKWAPDAFWSVDIGRRQLLASAGAKFGQSGGSFRAVDGSVNYTNLAVPPLPPPLQRGTGTVFGKLSGQRALVKKVVATATTNASQRFFARPRADGSYELNGLPPGTYLIAPEHASKAPLICQPRAHQVQVVGGRRVFASFQVLRLGPEG